MINKELSVKYITEFNHVVGNGISIYADLQLCEDGRLSREKYVGKVRERQENFKTRFDDFVKKIEEEKNDLDSHLVKAVYDILNKSNFDWTNDSELCDLVVSYEEISSRLQEIQRNLDQTNNQKI